MIEVPAMHISKADAKAEAVRLAEAFLVAEGWTEADRARFECWGANPAVGEPGHRDRKTVIKYTVLFHRTGWDGGEAIIRVNIKTQEAGWWS